MDALRVLIADDDAISRRTLQRAVEQAGHQCLVAADGTQAWEMFQQHAVDLLISDWMMPGMDGLELCQHVRAHGVPSYTYFILLTALDDKAHFLEGMQAGADDYLAKPFDSEALQARLLAAGRVMALHNQLARKNAELEELNRALAESAQTDPLTGLGNRLRLWEDLEASQAQVERYAYRFALAMCDVDHFKAYNDSYGHLAGDEALRTVAHALARQCRSGDRAFRYGGEEFVILFEAQDGDHAEIALTRICEAVRELAIPHPGNAPWGFLTISGGIAVADGSGRQTTETLLNAADEALYQAKESGRNRVVVHQASSPRPPTSV